MMLLKKRIGLIASNKDITLFFAILFFIVKYALKSIKYLIKFGIKHI